MLQQISVRNFAIIDALEIEFDDALTVMTGETGAGKSILVDALSLLLGARANSASVRQGAQRADISATFEAASSPGLAHWLTEHDLDTDDECVLRRVIGADGRSRAYINGNPVPIQNLKTVGQMLLDIHGQHAHQSLLRPLVQRALLDHHGKHKSLLAHIATAYEHWQELQSEHDKLAAARDARDSKLELLRFQVQELDAFNLQDDELENLDRERQRLANSARLTDGCQHAVTALYDSDSASAQSLLAETARQLRTLVEFDDNLRGALELVTEADVQVSEASALLRRYVDDLDTDPAEIDRVEARLAEAENLARKHRVVRSELPTQLGILQKELDDLENADMRLDELQKKSTAALTAYDALAKKLSTARIRAAKSLSGQISAAMQNLGMIGGELEVQLHSDADKRTDTGIDRVQFLVSANPGQDKMPLAKVASGGELSRISLAIQVIVADGNEVPTMVFDEVDSGVGGAIAEVVGRRLRDLGGRRQVLCVTHLPQVASQAHQHLRVVKMSDGKNTRTTVTPLTRDERVEELSRMLGGVKITKRTREHAREMLESAAKDSARRA